MVALISFCFTLLGYIQYLFPTPPSYRHLLTSKDAFLDTLELEDHSIWKMAPPDSYKIVGWHQSDILILTPFASLFSFYKFHYLLINLTQNSQVRVNFERHPCDYQKNSRWVISIDKFALRLFLNDGSCWKIDPKDQELFQNWDINDFIIYGKNDQMITSYPFILINGRVGGFVRAIEF